MGLAGWLFVVSNAFLCMVLPTAYRVFIIIYSFFRNVLTDRKTSMARIVKLGGRQYGIVGSSHHQNHNKMKRKVVFLASDIFAPRVQIT